MVTAGLKILGFAMIKYKMLFSVTPLPSMQKCMYCPEEAYSTELHKKITVAKNLKKTVYPLGGCPQGNLCFEKYNFWVNQAGKLNTKIFQNWKAERINMEWVNFKISKSSIAFI